MRAVSIEGATTASRALLAACCLVALLAGCSSLRAPTVRPVSVAASEAFARARTLARAGEDDRALAAANEAIALAPDWVAPRRWIDIFLTRELRGVEALASHRRALAERPDDGELLYLVGRLEGAAGVRRFEHAARVDPDLAWGWHGLAWAASYRGDLRGALQLGRRARDRARDPWERAFFGAALARYLEDDDRSRDALSVLEQTLALPGLAPADRTELEAQLALIELSMLFEPESVRGRARALTLLREREIDDAELERLVRRLRMQPMIDGRSTTEIELALAARPGSLRDRWRATLLLDDRATPLALALLERARDGGGRSAAHGTLLRAARFAAGQYGRGVDEWLGDLPSFLLDARGLPRDPRLAELVERARATSTRKDRDTLANLGEALIDVGWFREARTVAAALAEHQLDDALRLEDRALAGLDVLNGLRWLFESLDQRTPRARELRRELLRGTATDAEGEPIADGANDLDRLLAASAPLFARAHRWLGGETDVARLAAELVASPRQEFGTFAEVVHPGPWFSKADEESGRGKTGAPVPGLAAVLARLGRFGIVGKAPGAEVDGTILQRVWIEERSGEHLGVPWTGTVAWCEGSDLQARVARAGANIAGAALHEGYWIDIDSVRREHQSWEGLANEFAGDGGRERAERALATRGLELETPAELDLLRRAERRAIDVLLGEADRVRLAVLVDRSKRAQPVESSTTARLGDGGRVTLDDLVQITALHEEGHLCDRARFLPLRKNLGRVLAFLVENNFSPDRIAQTLEYRAQLVALCVAPEPRLPLAEILRASEIGEEGPTPHGGAYRRLLADFVDALDAWIEREPGACPNVDRERVLALELHRLAPQDVREAAKQLARSVGLYER